MGTRTTQDMLIDQVEDLVAKLNGEFEGDAEWHDRHGCESSLVDGVWVDEDGDECSESWGLDDLLEECLEGGSDARFTIGMDGSYIGVEVNWCTGGPGIWFDTNGFTVTGVWGSDKVTRSWSSDDELDVDSHYESLYREIVEAQAVRRLGYEL